MCGRFQASQEEYTGDGSVDFGGRPCVKESTGNWRACLFILGSSPKSI